MGHSRTGLSRGSNLISTSGAQSSCSASSVRTLRKLGGVTDGSGKTKDGATIGMGENGMDRVGLRQGWMLGEVLGEG